VLLCDYAALHVIVIVVTILSVTN